jgi:hypothetical protein
MGGPAYPDEINRAIRSAARNSRTRSEREGSAPNMQESPPFGISSLAAPCAGSVPESPGSPASLSGHCPDVGQWLCVPLFRTVCSFQTSLLIDGKNKI